MSAATKSDDYGREFSRDLPVELNEHELQAYGKMLAEKVNEEKLLEERKKQITAEWNQKIKGVSVEIARIADARAKGKEMRPVKCRERIHGNVIEVVRLDSLVVVDTRPADLRDLQTSLPGTGVPEMPDAIDEGPRGGSIGDDQPMHNGTEVVSSVGDTVHHMPDEVAADPTVLICHGCGDVLGHDEQAEVVHLVDDGTVAEHVYHAECAAEMRALDEEENAEPDNVIRPDFNASEQTQRDTEQREQEIEDEKTKPKPKRDRSKKSLASKAAPKRKR